jgi:hypothetical protein
MTLEEDFFASIKFKTGEEIFCKAAVLEEDQNRTLILINCPIVITEFKGRSSSGYKIEPWMKTTTNDMFVIDKNDILTMCETTDQEMISMYYQFTKHLALNSSKNPNQISLTKEQGYVSSVSEAKEFLEKLLDL